MSADDPEKEELCKHEGWTSIKEKKRHSTDILLTLMLIACWVAMTAVGLVVTGVIESENLSKGRPELLINSMDYNARICGVDSGVTDKPYGYYMMDGSVVCVEECPGEYSNLPSKFYCMDDDATEKPIVPTSQDNAYKLTFEYKCMFPVTTTAMLNRCVPSGDFADELKKATDEAKASTDTSVKNAATANPFTMPSPSTGSDWFNNLLADIYDNRTVVFGIGLGFANVVAFLYLYVLRIPGFLYTTIWGIILSIQFVLLVGGALLYTKASDWDADGTHSDSEVLLMQIASYIVLFLAIMYLGLMLVLRKRVQLAIAVIKEASRSLAAIPALIFMPVMQSLGLIIFLFPWVVYCVYLASSGEMKTVEITPLVSGGDTTTVRTFEYNANTRYAFLYMLFSYFWTSQFIVAFGQITIALAIVAWYFTRNKSEIGNGTLVWAAKTVGRYHMGTAAYGSLVIAIIKTIRAILMYIQKKAHDSQNKVAAAVVACISCCMWCVEKCMKFLNKNAYIQTAIYGTAFCASAKKAFWMIARNILRVMAVNMVGDFILMLGRLFVPSTTTFVAYLALAYQTGSTNGLVLPLVFTWLLAYFIGCMYSEIFGMSIETILNCYVADEEMFPPELRFAEGSLRDTMNITAKAHADTEAAKIVPEKERSSVTAAPAEEQETLL